MEVTVTPYYILRFSITVVCLFGIPTAYALSVYQISKRLSGRFAIMLVGALSMVSALVLWIAAAVISITFINCCFGRTKPFDHDFFNSTLAVPLNFCGTFHWIGAALGTSACRVLDVVGLLIGFLVAGVTLMILTKRHSQKPPGPSTRYLL